MKLLETGESVKMALNTLREHRFRSFLTVLGVVVGTMTVMVISSFIAGLDYKFQQEIKVFGSNSIWLWRFNPALNTGHLTPEERMRKEITFDDAMAIRQTCPSVNNVAPLLGAGTTKVRYQNEELYVTQVQGTIPDYQRMDTVQIGEGRFFTEAEDSHRSEVCVIGADIADKFFPNLSVLDKELLLDDKPFRIIGVLEKRDNFFVGENDGANTNRTIYVPYHTITKIYPQMKDNFVIIEAAEGKINQAQEEVRQVMRRRRNVPYDKEDNFVMATPDSITDRFHQITGGIGILMFVVSSVGLMIGGIGVMNIMLVSVTERTREIGVRKAIGARKRDILTQFLVEAIALTGSGGMLGILAGWGASLLVNLILPVYVPGWAPVVGMSVSVGIGLLFGLWPAMRAARLDPIVSLRYE